MRIIATEQLSKARLNRRRFVFFSSVFVLTSLATWFVADLYWRDAGLGSLEIALLALFVPLFAHIAVGFCTAFAGFYVINRGGDASRMSVGPEAGRPPRRRGLLRGFRRFPRKRPGGGGEGEERRARGGAPPAARLDRHRDAGLQ